MEDEYEEIDKLKHELAGRKELKITNEDLYASVKALSSQIIQLTEVFKMAITQMSNEDDAMQKIAVQLDMLLKNDQDLAKGLLLVLEIEKDRREMNVDKQLPLRRPRLRRRLDQRQMPAAPPLPSEPEEVELEFPEDNPEKMNF